MRGPELFARSLDGTHHAVMCAVLCAAYAGHAQPDALPLGRDLVGVRVSVWWEGDGRWYNGTIRDFSASGEHLIL